MASYSFLGDVMIDTTFLTLGGFVPSPVTISNGRDGDTFSVGERVTIKYSDTEIYSDTIVAFTSDGIVTENGGGYFFYTSNTAYEPGQHLAIVPGPYPVCFLKGTLIDTDRGAVAIESLVPGDQVVGSNGLGTVKWVGWRHYSALFLNTPEKRRACLPIRVSAGALGVNMPSHDLRVSPWHHLLVDGMLVRANDLVNGTSVVQETNTTEFTYYHVELERFDVISAHGVYSESWSDGGNRDFFQNVDVTTLRPEDKIRRRAPRPGFDHLVLHKGKELTAIQKRIEQRAQDIRHTAMSAQKAA